LKIDPETLPLKEPHEFKQEGLLERVELIRYHHYNQKRMKHLEIIDRFFKREDSRGEGLHSITSARGVDVPLQVPESLKQSQSYISATR
jgi:hypothetical protein